MASMPSMRREWKLWAVAFTVWVALYVAGEVLLPGGDFRDFLWPILAGVIVFGVSSLLSPAQRRWSR